MSSNHSGTSGQVLRFGSFEADLASGQLRKRGAKVPLRGQSFAVLATLLTHPGQVVTRDDLRHQLWHDGIHVDFEKSLNTVVGRLRAVLGDSAEHPRFIETLPKRGYRFLGDVYSIPISPAQGEPARLRLVVLPFANLTGDPALEYVSDAVTDEIITALAPIAPARLAVIARTTSVHYKGTKKGVGRIGRELDVDYAVEGTVRRADSHGEMNIQLIRTSDETHIFARKYEAPWCDLFAVNERVGADIAVHLGCTVIAPPAGSGTSNVSHDLVAYSEYAQGRQLNISTPESFTTARQHFEKAVARDPEFAQAHDALAELYWYLGYMGYMPPRKAFAIGIMHAMRALEVDNTRAETHALLGQFNKTMEYNWPEVHREMALALRLDPNSPVVRTRYAVSELMPQGRLAEAATELELALQFDPLSMWTRAWLGVMLLLDRKYDLAVAEARKILELDPACAQAHFILGVCYRYEGKCDDAIASLHHVIQSSAGVPSSLAWLGMTMASCGHMAEARDLLRQLQEMAAERYVSPSSFAWIHLGLRETDLAFEWLDRAVEECDQLMMPIKSYGFFDPLRGDARFIALLHKMRLEA